MKNKLAIKVDGVSYRPFAVEYEYKDKTWGIDVMATSKKDAASKIKAISCGQVLGEIHEIIEEKPSKRKLKAVKR